MQRYVPEITVFRIRSVCNVTYEVLKLDCITMVLAAWELNGAPQIAPLPVTLMRFPYFICIKFVSHAGLVSSHTSDLLSTLHTDVIVADHPYMLTDLVTRVSLEHT